MSKILKFVLPIASIALPIMFPGIGSALGAGLMGLEAGGTAAGIAGNALLGAGLGAAGSAANGSKGFLKSSLLGGLTGGLAGGGASELTGLTGLTGTGAKIASGALTGASAGGATGGDLKSALMGGVLGGAGAGLSSLGGEASSLATGNEPMTALSASGNPMSTTSNLMKGDYSGLTNLGSSGVAQGGGMSSLTDAMKLGSSIFDKYNTDATNEEVKKQLLRAQQQAEGVLSPYTAAGATATGQLSDALTQGFNPGDLTADAGYQFQLGEGQSALSKALASQGMGQSGAAVKAATKYSQGLADTTYNDAYTRWLQKNNQLSSLGGQGQTAATNMSNIYGMNGAINGMGTAASGQSTNALVSQLTQSDLLKKALLQGAGLFA